VTTPTISGTAQEGQTLTASANSGQSDNPVTYAWYSSADNYTNPIGTGASYQVKDGDEVEKLGNTEDGKWVYIRFTKTVDGAEKVEYGWCSADFVKVEGETPDTPVDTPDAPPAIDPV
jgi:hypothetical protein